MEKRVYSLISAARLRIRFQRIMEGLTTGLIASALVWMTLLVLYKTHWMSVSDLTTWSLVALIFPAAGLVWAFVHRIDPSNIALAIDDSNKLKGRLTSAYCFLELPTEERTPFMKAAIRESLEHMDNVKVGQASPFSVPKDLLAFVVVGVALGLVLLFKPPIVQGTMPPIVDPVVEVSSAFDDEVVNVELEKWKEIRDQLAKSDDPEAQEFAGEMDRLFEELKQQKLDKEKFLSEVDKIEKKFFENKDEGLDPLLEELKKVADEFKDNKETKALAKALAEKDLDKVAQELQKLSDKVEKGEISDKDLEKVAKKLEKLAKKFENEAGRLDKMIKDKEKEIEALKKKYEANKDKLSDSQKRRLSRLSRDLKKLKKKSGSKGSKSRKKALNRLNKASKEGSKMARSVKNKGKGAGKSKEERAGAKDGFKKNMGQASKDLKNMDKQHKTRQAMNKAKSQMGDMKEQISRGQKQSQDAKQKDMADKFKNAAEGKPAPTTAKAGQQGKAGKAPEGAKGEKSAKKGAGGKAGSPSDKDGKKDGKNAKGGSGKGESDGKGKTADAKGQGKAKGAGKGSGEGSGDEALGDASDLKDKGFKNTTLDGKMGDGPIKEEVILSAASGQGGFSSQGYKDVYVDFKDVAEEILESEQVPPGYQYYVRRYFDMIRPRDSE